VSLQKNLYAPLPHGSGAEDLWERSLLFSAGLQTPEERRELAIPHQQLQSKVKDGSSFTKKLNEVSTIVVKLLLLK